MSVAGAPADPHVEPEAQPVQPPASNEPEPAVIASEPAPSAPLAPQPLPERPNLATSRLARFGVWVVVFGFFLFGVGVFPEIIRLSITPGIGLLQILVLLLGATVMTLGA